MIQETTYTLEQFVDDIREAFGSKDPRAQAQVIAGHMQKILAVPGWLDEKIQEAEGSRVDLHLDRDCGHPGPGFLLMCSIQDPGRNPNEGGGRPHDHGASWVVYGVYRGAIEQTKYRWWYPETDWTNPQLKEIGRFVQRAGDVAFFLPGEIHKTVNAANERSLVLRVEGQKLDGVVRHRYDPETNAATVVLPER